MSERIYLDFQATTPLDPEVLEAMLPWLGKPANPHAMTHAWGREASAAVERAREQVAEAINGDPAGVIFTANATEAANIVLRSFAGPGRQILISAIEHPCVEETAAKCAAAGTKVLRIAVDEQGLIDLDAFGEMLDGCDVASVMAVNNEVGTIQPIDTIATLCRSADVLFHTDAAQALGRVEIDMTTGISFLTLSAHKVYGPAGIGALCTDPSVLSRLSPLTSGGGQQRGIRPGTLPVALCAGFGRACELAKLRMDEDRAHCASLSRLFLERLAGSVSGFSINGAADQRVPHNLNISFEAVEADDLLAFLPEIALSAGSACASGAIAPSRVLTAMGLPERTVRGAIRIGFGRTTKVEEVILAADKIGAAVRRLRGE